VAFFHERKKWDVNSTHFIAQATMQLCYVAIGCRLWGCGIVRLWARLWIAVLRVIGFQPAPPSMEKYLDLLTSGRRRIAI
jgi:hypothetical protein